MIIAQLQKEVQSFSQPVQKIFDGGLNQAALPNEAVCVSTENE